MAQTDYIKLILNIISRIKRVEDVGDQQNWDYIRKIAANAENQYFRPKPQWNPGLNESCDMKKNKLKPLIKTVLREMYKKQLNEWSTGTFDDYEIDLGSLVIPGLTTDSDSIIVNINIEYEGQAGVSAKGMGGPPENSSPAENSEMNILDWDFSSLLIVSEDGQQKQIDDLQTISKEQFEMLKKSVNDYIKINSEKIEEEIAEKLSNEDPDYPEYDENR